MKILIAEDDITVRTILESFVQSIGHDPITATDGREAYEVWELEHPRIVVTDWIMPYIDGLEMCRRIREKDDRYTYIMIVSSQDSQQDIVRGLEGGVDDYLTKPVNYHEFKARIEIGERIVKLETELIRRFDTIKRNYFQTVKMFTNLIEIFDEELGGHCRRVAELGLRIAKRHPDVSEQDYSTLEAASLLHDVGMIGLPNSLVTKRKVEMTHDEKKLYRAHPTQGEVILKEIEFLRPVSRLVKYHHEQFNGRGFPEGLKGDDIPLLSRIINAACAYDDLLRKWRVPLEDIPVRLQRQRNYELDPEIVDILLEINLDHIHNEETKGWIEVDIDKLENGMVLAKDIRMKRGALVMPADTELSEYGVEKLKNFLDLACISNRAIIYKF